MNTSKLKDQAVLAALTSGRVRVTPEGHVYGVGGNRIGSPGHPNGYRVVSVSHGGKGFTVLEHRLVWVAFNGPIPEGLVVNHLDGNKANNHPGNLEVVTPSRNSLHACEEKLWVPPKGQENGMAKITEDDVRQIRQSASEGVPYATLSKRYGLHVQSVGRIVRRLRWAHVD